MMGAYRAPLIRYRLQDRPLRRSCRIASPRLDEAAPPSQAARLEEWEAGSTPAQIAGEGNCSGRSGGDGAQPTRRLTAENFPLLPRASSYSTCWPSFRVESPARSTAEMCTKTSL